jgi:hypothetical protein
LGWDIVKILKYAIKNLPLEAAIEVDGAEEGSLAAPNSCE